MCLMLYHFNWTIVSNGQNRAFLALCRVLPLTFMVMCKRKEGKRMDTKKIGGFLKTLRREMGLTQEQLAEILLVSGRTVSRWETGTNMPDLSILIKMAEFYNVEVKEILDGEKKSENMDKEWKETLSKVADYNKLEREKANQAGNAVFGLTFVVCAAMIVIQLLMTGDVAVIAGETVVLLVGGVAYIGVMTYNGIWESGSGFKSAPFTDVLIAVVCAGAFAIALAICYIRLGAATSKAVHSALIFFAGITIVNFGVLRILAYFSYKRKDKNRNLY